VSVTQSFRISPELKLSFIAKRNNLTLLKTFVATAYILFLVHPVFSQVKDSAQANAEHFSFITNKKKPFPVKSFVIPTLAVAYGFGTMKDHAAESMNGEVKEEVWLEKTHSKTTLDNYLQWSPAAMVYGLNLAGLHGKNNFRDRTMIYLMSQVFMNVTVTSLKHITHQQRPDGSDYYSFPSGHTANAFVGAEFMWQEYKGVSPWLAASGYLIAATTGYLRMYNNKHWLSDVVAGAGIGVASTKLAYWLYPKFQHKLFKDKLPNTMIMPLYQNNSFGIGLVKLF
jgi:membrane-associated phospholipid phosphatase